MQASFTQNGLLRKFRAKFCDYKNGHMGSNHLSL